MSELALLGGKKSKTKPFPTWPQFDDTERRGLTEVLESGVWWRTPGTKTLEFEGAFARFHGARHGLAVTNGTAALEVAMGALGAMPGGLGVVEGNEIPYKPGALEKKKQNFANRMQGAAFTTSLAASVLIKDAKGEE